MSFSRLFTSIAGGPCGGRRSSLPLHALLSSFVHPTAIMLARVTPRREPISTLFAHRAISTSLSRAARPGGAATQHNSLARLIAPPSSSFASSSSSPFASSSSHPLSSSSSASASASSTPSSSVFDHLFPPPPTASKAGSDINTALDSLLSLSSLSPAEVELQNQLAIAAEEAEEESYALPSAWLAPTHPHTGRPRSLVGEHLRLLARESTGMKPLKPWREEEMEEQARELKSEIMRAIAIVSDGSLSV